MGPIGNNEDNDRVIPGQDENSDHEQLDFGSFDDFSDPVSPNDPHGIDMPEGDIFSENIPAENGGSIFADSDSIDDEVMSIFDDLDSDRPDFSLDTESASEMSDFPSFDTEPKEIPDFPAFEAETVDDLPDFPSFEADTAENPSDSAAFGPVQENPVNVSPVMPSFTPPPTGPHLRPNLELNRGFVLKRKIGNGTLGEAWNTRDQIDERDVVIKLVPRKIQDNEAAFSAFREAYRKAEMLSNDSICACHKLTEDRDNGFFTICDYHQSIPLDAYYEQYLSQMGEFSLSQAVRLFWPVARAIDYANSQKTDHGDIKPSNILIGMRCGVIVTDFHYVAAVREILRKLDGGMPADELQDPGKEDQAELAKLVRQLFYGDAMLDTEPFPGNRTIDGNFSEAEDSIDPNAPITIHSHSKYVKAAIQRALSPNPADRFASCKDFIRTMVNIPMEDEVVAAAIPIGAALVDPGLLSDAPYIPGDTELWPFGEPAPEPEVPAFDISFAPQGEGEMFQASTKMPKVASKPVKAKKPKRTFLAAMLGIVAAALLIGVGFGAYKLIGMFLPGGSQQQAANNPQLTPPNPSPQKVEDEGTGEEGEEEGWNSGNTGFGNGYNREESNDGGGFVVPGIDENDPALDLDPSVRPDPGFVQDDAPWGNVPIIPDPPVVEPGGFGDNGIADNGIGDNGGFGDFNDLSGAEEEANEFERVVPDFPPEIDIAPALPKTLEQLAAEGDAESQRILGENLLNGTNGYEPDHENAVFWLGAAATQGELNAQYSLGKCYEQGIGGLPKDPKEAFKLYKSSAEAGDLRAELRLAWCYGQGIGTEKDESKAAIWYMAAAEKGESQAQLRVGACFETGRGFEKDLDAAYKWYMLSADQGNDNAQYRLGIFYEYGLSVQKDRDEAYKWYKLSADQGNANAKEALKSF